MSTSSGSGGVRIGFLGLLALIFITLKLTGYITWSWWWVLAPLWGGFALVLFIVLGVFGAATTAVVVGTLVDAAKDSRRWGRRQFKK